MNSYSVCQSVKEDGNKYHVFSASTRAVRCAKDSAVKCLDLFKLSDKADGRSSGRPLGLSEKPDPCVNNSRRATSMSVIVALISSLSESQRRKGACSHLPIAIAGFCSQVNEKATQKVIRQAVSLRRLCQVSQMVGCRCHSKGEPGHNRRGVPDGTCRSA